MNSPDKFLTMPVSKTENVQIEERRQLYTSRVHKLSGFIIVAGGIAEVPHNNLPAALTMGLIGLGMIVVGNNGVDAIHKGYYSNEQT